MLSLSMTDFSRLSTETGKKAETVSGQAYSAAKPA